MQLIDKDKCLEQIKKITKDIEHSNPNIKFTYNKNEKTSRTYTRFNKEHNRYHIEGSTIDMGLYNLYYAAPNAENQIDAKYLVDFTKVIFHEMRHAYQTQTLFQNANLDDCSKNMARKYLLLYYFQSYYENPNTPDNYYHSPFEIDAEQHSLLDTVQYFDTHFLNENGNPRYNAKKMLYEMYKNEDEWYLPKQYRQNGFDNMIRNMETYKKRITQKTEDFGFPKTINYMTDVFLHHPFYQNYRTAFDNATVGTERDHILLQVILREDPAAATIFKCLSTECNTYLNLFERNQNPAIVISSKALQETLHSPHNTQKKSKVLNTIPKISESDKQKRNVDRITKAKHLCRNINYNDDTSYNLIFLTI